MWRRATSCLRASTLRDLSLSRPQVRFDTFTAQMHSLDRYGCFRVFAPFYLLYKIPFQTCLEVCTCNPGGEESFHCIANASPNQQPETRRFEPNEQPAGDISWLTFWNQKNEKFALNLYMFLLAAVFSTPASFAPCSTYKAVHPCFVAGVKTANVGRFRL